MYLAIVSTTLDDIPLRLTHDRPTAERVLETCTEADVIAAELILSRDAASVACGLIVRFDEHGKFIECSKGIELPQFGTCIGTDDDNN